MVKTFRPHPGLGVLMALAAVFWLSVLAFLARNPDMPAKAWVSTIFFLTLFVSSVFYYLRTTIVVTGEDVTYQGLISLQKLSFSEIDRVKVLPGLITVYTVQAGRKSISFTSFFTRHKELAELLRQRAQARLAPPNPL